MTLSKTAVLIISQTGGGCRASNYIGFIRRALEKAGMEQIPVISINLSGLEKNPGFKLTPAASDPRTSTLRSLAMCLCAASTGCVLTKQVKGTTDKLT